VGQWKIKEERRFQKKCLFVVGKSVENSAKRRSSRMSSDKPTFFQSLVAGAIAGRVNLFGRYFQKIFGN
jgi:hypothetical protein